MGHFSLTAWGPAVGSFVLFRADADWLSGDDVHLHGLTDPVKGWFSVTLGLFGFCACVTFWPGGKPA